MKFSNIFLNIYKRYIEASDKIHIQDLAAKPVRQRTQWSFLTWSFFLAEVVSMQQSLASGSGNFSPDDATRDQFAQSGQSLEHRSGTAQGSTKLTEGTGESASQSPGTPDSERAALGVANQVTQLEGTTSQPTAEGPGESIAASPNYDILVGHVAGSAVDPDAGKSVPASPADGTPVGVVTVTEIPVTVEQPGSPNSGSEGVVDISVELGGDDGLITAHLGLGGLIGSDLSVNFADELTISIGVLTPITFVGLDVGVGGLTDTGFNSALAGVAGTGLKATVGEIITANLALTFDHGLDLSTDLSLSLWTSNPISVIAMDLSLGNGASEPVGSILGTLADLGIDVRISDLTDAGQRATVADLSANTSLDLDSGLNFPSGLDLTDLRPSMSIGADTGDFQIAASLAIAGAGLGLSLAPASLSVSAIGTLRDTAGDIAGLTESTSDGVTANFLSAADNALSVATGTVGGLLTFGSEASSKAASGDTTYSGGSYTTYGLSLQSAAPEAMPQSDADAATSFVAAAAFAPLTGGGFAGVVDKVLSADTVEPAADSSVGTGDHVTQIAAHVTEALDHNSLHGLI